MASREAYVKIDERAPLVIVYSTQKASTGVRHATVPGSERALCGRRCEWWLLEARAFDASVLGCKTCKLRVSDVRA